MQSADAKGGRKDARILLQEDKIAAKDWRCIKLCGGLSNLLVESSGEPKSRKIVNKESKIQNRYLNAGTLTQNRDSRMNSRPSCKAIGRNKVLLMGNAATSTENVICVLSPTKPEPTSKMSPAPATPKSPIIATAEEAHGLLECRLEALPLDLLVRILCHLHHDELKAMFHVSKRIRKAVVIARRFHFNYITPDRRRCELLRRGAAIQDVMTPKAPRHGPRPPTRLSLGEMRQIAASLFQGSSSILSGRKPKGLARSSYRTLGSHRALFCEDELCQAIARNTIR